MANFQLDNELLSFVEEWRVKPGNLIMILHRAQQVYGYLPEEVIVSISKETGIPLSKIYGVITFYHYFKLNKPGEQNIQVCMGTACYLKGGQDIMDELEKHLGTKPDEVTEDGKFSYESVRCIGCCGLAPVAVVNNKDVFGKLPTEEVKDMLEKY